MDFKTDYLFFADMARFNRLYAKGLSKRLSSYGVRPGYLEILFRLWEQDGITQKSLHKGIDVEQATLSNTLKRMERDGLLLRQRNPKDRRQSLIVLTDTGAGLRKLVQTAIDDLQSAVNARLSVTDRRYFRRILKQMNEHLFADQDDATLVLLDEVDETEPVPLMLTDEIER
ncbi:Organic hydroperoxide resistance transcriptional regulator [Pseudodesulfovibrio hydrargyri]|uniref:Organic hydroperoxide resistance transcriptional regulator n=1 Tax=Pseudodesulfovibrio hydrargyri TaxID=2125990 RepID=A0A1J5N4W9_9BACT|nr:MarR family transcriptional regulator [Pseudodesulfovibrio hydrargyri]OIQ49888.1 Organic hydroperoxide resistance transcriptional regulator [Pseudodesulfovibrio hydrargyri]